MSSGTKVEINIQM